MMQLGNPGGLSRRRGRLKISLLISWALLAAVGALWAGGWIGAAEPAATADKTEVAAPENPGTQAPKAPAEEGGFKAFGPFRDSDRYPFVEQAALVIVLLIAVAGLVYAGMLVKQVTGADQGTPQDAGDRRGGPRRGQRLPGGPVPQDRAADHRHHDRAVLHEI